MAAILPDPPCPEARTAEDLTPVGASAASFRRRQELAVDDDPAPGDRLAPDAQERAAGPVAEPGRFKGATPREAWNRANPGGSPRSCRRLQWGHADDGVEEIAP